MKLDYYIMTTPISQAFWFQNDTSNSIIHTNTSSCMSQMHRNITADGRSGSQNEIDSIAFDC